MERKLELVRVGDCEDACVKGIFLRLFPVNGEKVAVEKIFNLKRYDPRRLNLYFDFPLNEHENHRYALFQRVYGERALSEIEMMRKIGCLESIAKSDIDFYKQDFEKMFKALYIEMFGRLSI